MQAEADSSQALPSSRLVMRGKVALPALTSVRFLAAFYIVLDHGLPFLEVHHHVPDVLRTFLQNGSLAVGFFFVLSGFILTYTYGGRIGERLNRNRFWRARFARIYPVYFLALALAYPYQRSLSLTTKLTVLFMVQGWNPLTPERLGAWNFPAWSLSAEALYYLCFPFLLSWMSKARLSTIRLSICILACICVFGHTMAQGLGNFNHSSGIGRFLPLPVIRFPEFLLGIALGLVFLRLPSNRASARPLRLYFAIVSVVVLLSIPIGAWVSLVVIPFSVLTYDLACGQGLVAKILSTRLMVLLGGASYSIYLLQYPVRAWVRELFSLGDARFAFLGQVLTPVILVGFSILVFICWEEPLRKAIRGRPVRTAAPSLEYPRRETLETS
jgi:peptidoglycan/LPS O-acetylase OafA/YrhL